MGKGSSNENPKKIIVNGGLFQPTENLKDIKMPPEATSKKEIVNKGEEILGGEIIINLVDYKAEIDNDGKHFNVVDLKREESKVVGEDR